MPPRSAAVTYRSRAFPPEQFHEHDARATLDGWVLSNWASKYPRRLLQLIATQKKNFASALFV